MQGSRDVAAKIKQTVTDSRRSWCYQRGGGIRRLLALPPKHLSENSACISPASCIFQQLLCQHLAVVAFSRPGTWAKPDHAHCFRLMHVFAASSKLMWRPCSKICSARGCTMPARPLFARKISQVWVRALPWTRHGCGSPGAGPSDLVRVTPGSIHMQPFPSCNP